MAVKLKIEEAPLRTRLGSKRRRGRTRLEFTRERAKVVVKERDDNTYIAGVKRGPIYVKKMFIDKRDEEGNELALEAVHDALREKVLAGDFDDALTEGYKARTEARKRRPRKE